MAAERGIRTMSARPARALFGAALAALLCAAAPAHAAGEPYRLGVALGFSGTGKPYSDDGLRGIELAVAEINAAGGLLGRHPIELVVGNTRTDPKVAAAVVEGMIREKQVRAVIGTYSSAAALAIKPILRENRVLHVATISNSEDITKLDFSPYTFSVVPNTYMMAKAVALATARLARERGWKTYATIASDYAWGRSSQQLQVALLQELVPELKLVSAYWPPLGHSSFNTFVVALMNDAPDFVLESIAGTDNDYWRRAAHDYRLFRQIETPGSLLSVVELTREKHWIRRGAYGRTRAPFFAHPDVPMMQRFVQAYRARHGGSYPSDWAVMSYDGVHAVRQGVEKAGTVDSERVKDAMRGLAIETTRGRLSFREIDNQLGASAYFGRVVDDPRFDFPVYADLVEFKGPDIWRPEEEIREARK